MNPIYRRAWDLEKGFVVRMRSTGREVTIRKVERLGKDSLCCVRLQGSVVILMLLNEDFCLAAYPEWEYRVIKAVKLPVGCNRAKGFWPTVYDHARAGQA